MPIEGLSKWELDTPCLVIAEEILQENIRKMQDHAASFSKKLRPHAKTHKCSRIARMQMEAGSVGICVAKVSEAEVLVDRGFRGVLITSPVVTDFKIRRLMNCLDRDPDLMVVVDSPANAGRLNDEAARRGLKLGVLVDLDPGMGRTGVALHEGLALGKQIEGLRSLRLRGVQCYAGQVQHIRSFEERCRASSEWMGQTAGVVRQFRKNGLPCDILTGGGTGTYDIDCRIAELTDLQVGSYVMMDSDYLNIGSSQDPYRFVKFPPSLTLLTTVISANRPGRVTVDAGTKSIYRDGGTPYVLDPSGSKLKFEWWGDEHGRILLPEGSAGFEIGDVLELVVSHCDPTVNLFDELYVTREGSVKDVWPIDMRGRSQ